MLVTTTPTLEGHQIVQYLGLVSGEVILGANVFKDFFAGIRDIVGGRAESYEEVRQAAKRDALREIQSNAEALGANAIVGVDMDFETIGSGGSMLMVAISGTAVIVR